MFVRFPSPSTKALKGKTDIRRHITVHAQKLTHGKILEFKHLAAIMDLA